MSEAGVTYAGFWRRVGALLVDGLVGIPLFGVQFALFRRSTSGAVISLLVPGVMLALYPAVFHARWGQTIGKMATRIKVVRLGGAPIGVRAAFLRSSVDLVLWFMYTVLTAGALLSWAGPEWSSLTWIQQNEALSTQSVMFGLYSWLSQIWLWSEVVVLLFNRKRRALHDFIAGTIVIRLDRPFPYSVPPPLDEKATPKA